MATTTIRQLTRPNVIVLNQYRDQLDGVIEIGATYIKFFGNAKDTFETLRKLKDHVHATKGGRSFENRSLVAVVNKIDKAIHEGGSKHVVVKAEGK